MASNDIILTNFKVRISACLYRPDHKLLIIQVIITIQFGFHMMFIIIIALMNVRIYIINYSTPLLASVISIKTVLLRVNGNVVII